MHEIGVNSENGFIVNFSLTNLNIDDLYTSKKKFKYEPKKDTWSKHLLKGKSTYPQELSKTYIVEALDTYVRNEMYDAYLKRIVQPGEQWEVDYNRLQTLTGDNELNEIFVKLIGEKTLVKEEMTNNGKTQQI